MKRIVIFASGSGTNAENIIRFFNQNKTAKVTQVLCNNEHAKVIDRCKLLKISCLCFNKNDFLTAQIDSLEILQLGKENPQSGAALPFLH